MKYIIRSLHPDEPTDPITANGWLVARRRLSEPRNYMTAAVWNEEGQLVAIHHHASGLFIREGWQEPAVPPERSIE